MTLTELVERLEAHPCQTPRLQGIVANARQGRWPTFRDLEYARKCIGYFEVPHIRTDLGRPASMARHEIKRAYRSNEFAARCSTASKSLASLPRPLRPPGSA